jgi:hypothetical protein
VVPWVPQNFLTEKFTGITYDRIGLAHCQGQSVFYGWPMKEQIEKIFPVSCAYLPEDIASAARSSSIWSDVDSFVTQIGRLAESAIVPAYLPDLARVERVRHDMTSTNPKVPLRATGDSIVVNPTLQAVEVNWQPLLALLDNSDVKPEPASQILIFWQNPDGTQRQAANGFAGP